MPKIKTHKGLSTRVRVTPSGKVVRHKAGKSHLMSTKSGKKCRQLRRTQLIKGRIARTVLRKLAGG